MNNLDLNNSLCFYNQKYNNSFSSFKSQCMNSSYQSLFDIGIKHFYNHIHWQYTSSRKKDFFNFISLLKSQHIQSQINSFTTFQEISMFLHLIKLNYFPNSSIGATILYDFSLLLALNKNIFPDYVYLNNRTTIKQAIIILGKSNFLSKRSFFPLKNYKHNHIILKSADFPYPLNQLNPIDLENFLCLYKNINKSITK